MNEALISLRRAKPDDASSLAVLMADEAVFGNLPQLPYPTEAMWRERLEAKSGNGDLQLVAIAQEQIIGSAGLHSNLHVRRRHAMSLGISVAAQSQGQGVGSALMAALMDYADRWAAVLRIELTVFADNARAVALYQKFGLVQEGLLRAYGLRAGRYQDTLTMARLHPHPPARDL